MERAIDKIILYSCTVYLLCLSFSGTERLITIYLTLAYAAAMLWLVSEEGTSSTDPIRSYAARILMYGAVLIILIFPRYYVLLPLVVYDMVLCRQWAGLAVAAIALVKGLFTADMEVPDEVVWITFAATLLSLWLAAKSVRLNSFRKQVRKLRDDDEEQREKLNRQNEELLSARDSEVVTAQLQERNRIAREIHDNVGHTLSRALLQVGALLAIHKEEPVHTELSGVRETLDSAMTSIRSSVHDLHDSSVNLETTVQQMLEPLKEDFHVSVEIDVSEDMPRDIKYSLIGILREGVSNIMRHSLNDTVLLQIMEHPGFYQMILHDYLSEGGEKRMSPVTGRKDGTPGIGLSNIESRVRKMGGTLQIQEEEGFRLFISVKKTEKK